MNFVEDFYSTSSQVIPSEERNQYANGLAGPIPNGSGNSSGYHSGSATPPSYSLTSTVPSAQVINIGTVQHHVHQYFGSHSRPSSTLELQSSAFHNVIHSPMETSQGQPSSDSLHQKIIQKHATMLQDGMDPDILLSHLMGYDLVTREDIEIIQNKYKTTQERNMRILTRVLFRGSGACERFVSCLEEATEHPRHGELAQILHSELDQLTQRRYKQRSKKQCRRKHSLSLEVTSSSDTASEPEARITPQRKMQTKFSQDEASYMKLQWLDDNVFFENCGETITLTSKTNYKTERQILDWESFYEHGSLRILILCNDCLLLLKPVEGHNFHNTFKWFSRTEFTVKMPLLLHVLEAEKNPDDKDSFVLRVKSHTFSDEVHLQAENKLARNFWVKTISDAVKRCKDARTKCAVPMWNIQSHTLSTESWKISLSILDASVNASALPAQSSTHHLFCSVRLISNLGNNRLSTRTTTVGVNIERKARAFWKTEELVISKFKKTDILEIRVMQENSFRPNDVVGDCKVNVSTIATGVVQKMNMPLMSDCQESGTIQIALGSYKYDH